jgi:FkbM family methyltransferase
VNSNIFLILRRKGLGALLTAIYFHFKAALYRSLGRRFMRRRVRDFEMMIDLKDPGISRTLLLFGRREEEHVIMLREVLRPGMTVFDVGANIGYYVLIERSLVGSTGHIVAIEPSPQNVELLRRNVGLNGSSNVTIIQMGVSSRAGRQPFHLSHQSNLNTFHPIGSVVKHLDNRVIDVDIDTVPAIADRVGRIPDLIRMDVEGHEVEIINGILPAIQGGQMAPMFLFETHLTRYTPDHDFEPPLRALFNCGYRVRCVASSSEAGTAMITERGYRGGDPIETDMIERVIFEDIGQNDLIDLVCRKGGVRAVLLSK